MLKIVINNESGWPIYRRGGVIKLGRCEFRLILFLLLGICASARGAEQNEVLIERNVPVKMRDGVILRANVFRPNREGTFPVLLERTPYDKEGDSATGLKVAKHGYVAVIQDCRGRFASEGTWYPFRDESRDGYDTVEWAARLPYSNGKVGLIQSSYVGATQLLAAVSQPPHLVGLMPEFTASDYHDGWVYQGGAFELWFNETWTARHLAADSIDRWFHKSTNVEEWVWKLPAQDYPPVDLKITGAVLAPYFRDWLDHPSYDSYWKQLSIEEQYDKICVPAYHTGGWYDVFLRGTLRNYMGIKAHGCNESVRRAQRLLIGPWAHGPYDGRMSELDLGLPPYINWKGRDERWFAWYDHLLKGATTAIDHEKPVEIFVMGVNKWREEESWPLARARNTNFYLNSSGRANSEAGDGTLRTSVPGNSPPDSYVYDPANPVPTLGGALCCAGQYVAGAFDQRPVETRQDVLVYSTPPFPKDFEVTGPISLVLYVSSTAQDTDFTGKLVDVSPNGVAKNLTDGIMRTRYRESQEKPELMTPGHIYEVTVDLVATSNVFLAGHRVRLEVSSSNFPRFERNLNTGEDPGTTAHSQKAINTIYHDDTHPSALILPVVSP